MRRASTPVLLLLGLSLLASCASSRGSTYEAGASDEASAAAASARAATERGEASRPSNPQPSPPTGGGLFGAVLVESPPPPPPPKGHLLFTGLPEGAELSVDGLSIYRLGGFDMGIEVEPGLHELLVRRFGFEDWRESISIGAEETLHFSPLLLPASFGLRSFDVQPNRFNPADPGYYGRARLSLDAVAPGRLDLVVLDGAGRVRYEVDGVAIDRSRWSWSWDGRDGGGRVLPPGTYTILARSPEGGELGRAELEVDPSTFARSAILASGSGGALFVPAARAAQAGGLEASSFVLGHILSSEGPPSGRLLSGLGTRLGIASGGGAPEQGYELDLSVLGIFHPGATGSPSTDAYLASLSFLAPLSSGPLLSSVLVKLSYGSFLEAGDWPSPYDGLARFPGLSLALPLEYEVDSVRGFLAPEIALGRFYPGYDPARVPGFYSWAYLRAGFESSFGPFSLALSAALRSLPLDRGFGISWPLPAGLELRWHASQTPLVLSLLLSGEFDSRSSWYLNSGLGLGYRL